MKQPDFFRLFSEKMRGASPPPDFSGDDWQVLQTRLDAHDRKRWRVLPLGWLWGLTGLLLLSNLGWLFLLKKTDDKVAALRSEQPAVPQESITLRDTVFEKTVVFEYDTIYRTVVVNRMEASRFGHNLASQDRADAAFFTKKTTTGGAATPTSTLLNPTGENGQVQPPHQITTTTTTTTTAGADAAPGSSTVAGRPILPKENDLFIVENNRRQPVPDAVPSLEMRPLLYLLRQPVLRKKEDFAIVPAKENKTAFPLIPRSFGLGIGAGTLNPKSSELKNTSGKVVSIASEIGFSEHLALTLIGTYGGTYFKGFDEYSDLGLPHFEPPEEYELKYFEADEDAKNILQLAVGMRWYFATKSKLNPWVGAGWTAQWNPAYLCEVEYINPISGDEISEEIYVPALPKPLSYGNLNLGIRYSLYKNWYLQAGGFWDFKIDKQAGIGRWSSWQAGVAFRFL
ncbi:MAG: porin family protein [Saprospiraceae bacterium]|nr:porin family protein [Saprospiraceae bacterium]MCF8251905.1 porin family protein [Saprospiraceae bacterium]MCF8281602.1 porin family protein [Bacteroidales bacterium]MCF8313579.1 porin family protein [Saprospiraceae bacterium]MCF8442289.1 porin family protein [Saprospiraceae bacterium]